MSAIFQCDMENELTDEELENLEEENGFIASFRTSAKDNFGIDEAFRCVANKVRGSHECELFASQTFLGAKHRERRSIRSALLESRWQHTTVAGVGSAQNAICQLLLLIWF